MRGGKWRLRKRVAPTLREATGEWDLHGYREEEKEEDMAMGGRETEIEARRGADLEVGRREAEFEAVRRDERSFLCAKDCMEALEVWREKEMAPARPLRISSGVQRVP